MPEPAQLVVSLPPDHQSLLDAANELADAAEKVLAQNAGSKFVPGSPADQLKSALASFRGEQ